MSRRSATVLGILTFLLFTAPDPVAAYVGPGVGLAAIGAALAVVGSVLLGVAGFVWYPIKRLFRLFSRSQAKSQGQEDT